MAPRRTRAPGGCSAAAEKGDLHDRALWTPTATAAGAGGNTTALVGSPETVAAAILDYVEIGVDTVLIRGYDPLDDAVDYGRYVIPLVRQELATVAADAAPVWCTRCEGSGSSSSPTSRPGRSRACCSPTWAPTWSSWSRRPATRCGRGRRSPRTTETGEQFSHNFASVNRNKRSVVVDLKDTGDTGGLARARALVAEADVVVENYRPGVLDRLGLGYDEVTRDRDRGLVYCSVSGYGLTSPYVNDGAYDVVIQGMSGVMSVTGERARRPGEGGRAVR